MKVLEIEYLSTVKSDLKEYYKYNLKLNNGILLGGVFLENHKNDNARITMTTSMFEKTLNDKFRTIMFCLKTKMNKELIVNFDNYINICNYYVKRKKYHSIISDYNNKISDLKELQYLLKKLTKTTERNKYE